MAVIVKDPLLACKSSTPHSECLHVPNENASRDRASVPRGRLPEAFQYLRYDLISGFLVFLIALPLCLAIAKASGFPPIGGIFTAIVGGIVSAFLSNSELTIKGPAAGMIVIVLGCVTEFGFTGGQDAAADFTAYKMALGVAVVAAGLQILFALTRAGSLGDLFPSAAVHGLLASIGVIIMAKQLPIVLGADVKGDPIELILQVPQMILKANPEIAMIGILCLAVMFLKPLIPGAWMKRVPSQLVAILAAIPLGVWFDLSHEHTYTFYSIQHPMHLEQFKVGENYLVSVPNNMLAAISLPDFSGLTRLGAWQWVAMFAIIGSLESLLSAKAVDLLDPWKRKANLDRDLFAVGVGNMISAFIGGLPMISEIVRSRANVDNGARTRFANLYHGLFLAVCVAAIPFALHQIPLAALAAMLVYTGFRLAHPKEFLAVYKIGTEQLIVFVTTIIAVLFTDLLIGILIGVAMEMTIHLLLGAPIASLIVPSVRVTEETDERYSVTVDRGLTFSNWLFLRGRLNRQGLGRNRNVVIDLSQARFVDHTVMEKLHEMERDFEARNLTLTAVGLERLRPISNHPFAARKQRLLPTG